MGQLVVEVELVAVQVERRGVHFALREQLVGEAGLGVGEGDECLLGATEVERGLVAPQGLLKALDVAVDVAVQQREEQAEVLGVALVGRGGHEQEVVGHRRKRLAELVGERLAVAGVGAHLVGLVDDDEVPARPEQALLGVLDPRHPRERGEHLVTVLPRVLAVVGAEDVAADDLERLAELVLEFALPLEGEVGRRDDERPLDEPAGLQLLEQEPGHDCLASAGVVGQQKADARELEEVIVDGLQLVRQGVDTGDREREVRVVLVRQPEPVGLDPEPEERRVVVERLLVGRDSQPCDLLGTEHRVVSLPGLEPPPDDLERRAKRHNREHLDRFRDERPADDRTGPDGGSFGRDGGHGQGSGYETSAGCPADRRADSGRQVYRDWMCSNREKNAESVVNSKSYR